MITQVDSLLCHTCELVKIAEIPSLNFGSFAELVIGSVEKHDRLIALFAQPSGKNQNQLFALITARDEGALRLCSTVVTDKYPSLTLQCTQAHWFEREIAESFGITPVGHPWLKPIRFISTPIGDTEFYKIGGHEAHDAAVGPVHAGII